MIRQWLRVKYWYLCPEIESFQLASHRYVTIMTTPPPPPLTVITLTMCTFNDSLGWNIKEKREREN